MLFYTNVLFSDPFRTGTQADDIRIDVTQRIIRAPDYTSQGRQRFTNTYGIYCRGRGGV